MTIDFFDGRVTPEQHVVVPEMRGVTIEALKDGEWCFAATGGLWMDKEFRLWLDKQSIAYMDVTDSCLYEELIRVIKLPEGLIVDISLSRSYFEDFDSEKINFVALEKLEYEDESYKCESVPVVGLISSEMEIDMFRSLVLEHYGYDYPELEVDSEVEDE